LPEHTADVGPIDDNAAAVGPVALLADRGQPGLDRQPRYSLAVEEGVRPRPWRVPAICAMARLGEAAGGRPWRPVRLCTGFGRAVGGCKREHHHAQIDILNDAGGEREDKKCSWHAGRSTPASGTSRP